MYNRVKKIIPFLIGIIIFICIYGIQILNPFYDAWLLQGRDLTQHYLGSLFFRMSSWQFPLGDMNRICYPGEVSVVYTDSIPIVAIIIKLFRGILPLHFQYFGWWGIMCFGLQGYFAARLLSRLIKDDTYVWICCIFYIISPVFLYRMFMHTALASEWLILWSLDLGYCLLKESWMTDQKHRLLLQSCLMGALAAGIHIYLLVMCTIIISLALLIRLINGKTVENRKKVIAAGAAYYTSAVIMLGLIGALQRDQQMDAGGLTQFSFNLNGFINPMDGWSKLLPTLSAYGEGYSEGLAYLGVGILLLLILVAGCGIIYKIMTFAERKETVKQNRNLKMIIFFILIVIFCTGIAISPVVALNAYYYVSIPYPKKLVSMWGIVRSSGRFIWPVVDILMLWGMTGLWKILAQKRRYMSRLVILVLLLLQVYDLSGKLLTIQQSYASKATYVSLADTESIWKKIAASDRYAHIVFTSDVTENQGLLYSISELAVSNHMTINMFYFAHNASMGDINDNLEISPSHLSADTVYVFMDRDADDLMKKYASLTYYRIDGGYVGVTQAM